MTSTSKNTPSQGTATESRQPEKRDRCANEPWPCYRPDCSGLACVSHRSRFPNCKGYACDCR